MFLFVLFMTPEILQQNHMPLMKNNSSIALHEDKQVASFPKSDGSSLYLHSPLLSSNSKEVISFNFGGLGHPNSCQPISFNIVNDPHPQKL
jgi:hypothetical protein